VDIDHILPFSRSLDDSNANKILCLKEANRHKGNRAPAEVSDWDYEAMLERAQKLPPNKRWRFAKDAMQRFEDGDNWLARQLTDTQYLSRLARAYLASLYPGEEADEQGELRMHYHIRTIPGRLTELLRRNWGLNALLPDYASALACKQAEHEGPRQSDEQGNPLNKPKNRQDHRHHAIDAAVIGLTTRAQLQKISAAAKQKEGQEFEDFVKLALKDSLPWQGFREDLQAAVNSIIVSHKPDHGTLPGAKARKAGKGKTAAKLMKETAYGLPLDEKGERLKNEKGNELVVWRIPLRSLNAKNLGAIRDAKLRALLEEHIYAETGELKDGKAFEQALLSFKRKDTPYKGLRHLRIMAARNVIPIYSRQDKAHGGRPYKGYWNDGNYRYDVWQTSDGKWKQEVITMFDAHQPGYESPFHKANPTAKKVLSLQQNDMVAYNDPESGERVIGRVVQFDKNGSIYFAAHNEANVDARNRDKSNPFNYLKKAGSKLKELNCRQIRVDEIGQVFDPQGRAHK